MTSTVTTEWQGDEFMVKLRGAVDTGLAAAAFTFMEVASRSMPGSGAAKSGKNYTPSRAGSPPGVRTNRLKSSLVSEKIGDLTHAYGTNVKYARIHELGGTVKGGRPYFVRRGGAQFIKETTAARLEARGKHVGRTKPLHVVPARPFLRPAIANGKVAANASFRKAASRALAASVLQGTA